MADPIKRVNYFDHQFLHVDDFIDEQKYHIGLRRLHNKELHTWGIARGLDLSFKMGESRATVSEGVAVDGNGREIVLAESRSTPDLSGNKNKTVYITITYSEKETDSTTETGVSGETRLTEEPEIGVVEDPPVDPSQELILGRLMLDKDAKINGKDEGEEPNKRRLAGVIGGDLEARSLKLSLPDAASSQWPALSCSAANQINLIGSLSISGNVGIGTTEPKSPLSVYGGAAIGAVYATNTAPANGLIVQGKVGIGTAKPEATLDVKGPMKVFGSREVLYNETKTPEQDKTKERTQELKDLEQYTATIKEDTAKSDGFVVAVATVTARNAVFGLKGYAGAADEVRGAASVNWVKEEDYPIMFNSFTMPVRKGEKWTICFCGNDAIHNHNNGTILIYWIPLGYE